MSTREEKIMPEIDSRYSPRAMLPAIGLRLQAPELKVG
jgi:hypothetical protein